MLHTADGFLLPAFIAPSPDTLWLLFDSGAGRTLLSREAADRLGLHATAQGTIHGVGSGAVPVSIVPAVTLALPGIRLDSVDLRLTPKSELSSGGSPGIDGIIGYDLLCTSVVTVDFGSGHVTVLSPRHYHAAPSADVRPLLIRNGWPYVRATIKVPGQAPVDDDFLIDTGSSDYANHPIIQQSSGPLRKRALARAGSDNPKRASLAMTNGFGLATRRSSGRRAPVARPRLR